MLRLGARIESHPEVLALVVRRALLARGLGQEEGAPVGEAADDAAGGEDERAGGAGDFFDLGEGAMGADLVRLLVLGLFCAWHARGCLPRQQARRAFSMVRYRRIICSLPSSPRPALHHPVGVQWDGTSERSPRDWEAASAGAEPLSRSIGNAVTSLNLASRIFLDALHCVGRAATIDNVSSDWTIRRRFGAYVAGARQESGEV